MKEQERKYAIVVKKERVEVTEEIYKNYYRLVERERYLNKLAERKHISIEACQEKGVQVEYIISHTEESIEDSVIRQEMLDKLALCVKMLPEQELLLIRALFFQGKSERQLSSETGVPLMTLNDRKRRILKKLKKLLEK
jgi:DNA-directed RNA polymerase specialized sigma24 family protein